jgi:PAS domain S-box-containing protein
MMSDPMRTETGRSRSWVTPAVLLVGMGALAGAYAFAPRAVGTTRGLSDSLVAVACLTATIVIARRRDNTEEWRGARFLAFGTLSLAAISLLFAVQDIRRDIDLGPIWYDVLFVLVALVFLVPIVIEFADHFAREDRREIGADVALISATLGTILYLLIRPEGAGPNAATSSAVFALIAAGGISAYGALALWVPSIAHVGQFLVVGAFSVSVLAFGQDWVNGTYRPGSRPIDMPFALGALALAFLVYVLPRQVHREAVSAPTRYGRPILTTVAVATACGALGLVATLEQNRQVDVAQGQALIGLLALAIAVRILVNQVRSIHATRAARDALGQKEVALRETDKALARLQRANETLRDSEERLRLVFEAAVDGIVELDEKDAIVRANEAFAQMLEMPQGGVEGQPWTSLAATIEADETFASLPSTGQGTLMREGNAIYLEARTSLIPGNPPRRLLLVRDVTAQRVADQTIRSLFKFLQDRDEDRTRIMRRINAAIESERNRIARDLHDGPVQGLSAASLSLEAVLLMLRAGELDEGVEILTKVRKELAEEADNLRRLMSGLRPPLLEERGLVPALRETLDKFGRDNGIQTEFFAQNVTDVPQDLETLAYRVVQEALSNASKHARASRIKVVVEALAGQLRIEVVDDGVGFDSAKAREYLQMGRVGLASMRERVELANGTFMVHSNLGRGTTVLATLPLESVPAPREFAVNEAL